ncbi:MAG: VanW family protein [Candidatus Margulisbacteria bacterium]|nr:VanW family protein [Candidatus Margulisiibacteriota bacterium]
MSKFLKTLGIAAFIAVVITAGFVVYDFFQTRQIFPKNTYIGSADVSFLTEGQAIDKLKIQSIGEIFTPLLTLEASGESFAFSPDQLGVYILHNETVKKAFELTHHKNYIKDLKSRLSNDILVAPLYLGVHEEVLKSVLVGLAEAVRAQPRDASFLLVEDSGAYHIEDDEVGKELAVEKSIDLFKSNLAAGYKVIPLAVNFSFPKITAAALRAHPPAWRIAAYTTYYGSHDSPNRIHNIKLIASWINDTLLMPGDKFSVAEKIGDVTAARGFKEAFVIVGGELAPLLGGGACQTATTLYNTVSLADLKVTQRRNHSFYFNIYPLGRDAGVYPGQLDMQFENNTGHPILIKAVATNRRLSFRVYGTPTGKKVVFSSPRIWGRSSKGYVPMSLGAVIKYDIPFKTEVVRTVYDSTGKKIHEEAIHSFYKLYGEKSNVPIRRPEPR